MQRLLLAIGAVAVLVAADPVVIRAKRQSCGSAGFCGSVCCVVLQAEPQQQPNCGCQQAQQQQPSCGCAPPVQQQPDCTCQNEPVCPCLQINIVQQTIVQAPTPAPACQPACQPVQQDPCCPQAQPSCCPPAQDPCCPQLQQQQSSCSCQPVQDPCCPQQQQPSCDPCPPTVIRVQISEVQQQDPCCPQQQQPSCCPQPQQSSCCQAAPTPDPCACQPAPACNPCAAPTTPAPAITFQYSQSVQCVPACQPSCQPSCMSSYPAQASQYSEATTTCDAVNCVCKPGYVQCAQETCCLRYRYMKKVRRSVESH